MKIFFDTEFTGLIKNTDLISIGIVAEDGRTFYAELTDFSLDKCDLWIKKNVIGMLKFQSPQAGADCNYAATKSFHNSIEGDLHQGYSVELQGNTKVVKAELTRWLSQFKEVEVWSDCLAYDWVLFNNIFGHAFNIPENVYYIPFDICTLFKVEGIDPDISRELFCGLTNNVEKHNALWDAKVIKACFEKLQEKRRVKNYEY